MNAYTRKAKLLSKKLDVKREKANEQLVNSLHDYRISYVAVLPFLMSEAVYYEMDSYHVWNAKFEKTLKKVFEYQDISHDILFSKVLEVLIPIQFNEVYLFGDLWKDQGAIVIQKIDLIDKLPEVFKLVSSSFFIIDDTFRNGFRLDANEIGNAYDTAIGYITGSNWHSQCQAGG